MPSDGTGLAPQKAELQATTRIHPASASHLFGEMTTFVDSPGDMPPMSLTRISWPGCGLRLRASARGGSRIAHPAVEVGAHGVERDGVDSAGGMVVGFDATVQRACT